MTQSNVHLLREALPYINKFSGTRMVVKIGGETSENRETLRNFCEQVALCVRVGIKMVIVHGGGKQATELSRKLGIEPKMIDGRRITDDGALEVTKMVFAGQINTDILTLLRQSGIKSVGLSGIDGNLINAVKRPPVQSPGKKDTIDFGWVGDIVDVNPKVLHVLLEGNMTPVVASLASDNSGAVYNINADTVACAIAQAMNAEKLILVTNVDGIMDSEGQLISRLKVGQTNELIEDKTIKGGMLPKVKAAVEALRNGVSSVHIINGLSKDSLLEELFTEFGRGTMLEQ